MTVRTITESYEDWKPADVESGDAGERGWLAPPEDPHVFEDDTLDEIADWLRCRGVRCQDVAPTSTTWGEGVTNDDREAFEEGRTRYRHFHRGEGWSEGEWERVMRALYL